MNIPVTSITLSYKTLQTKFTMLIHDKVTELFCMTSILCIFFANIQKKLYLS